MATKLVNPFPAGSKLTLSILIESSTLIPIIHELKAKYRADIGPMPSSPRGNSFAPGEPIRISLFHHLVSKDYELYRSSLTRIVRNRDRFSVVVAKPFTRKGTENQVAGFNAASLEVTAIRDELARDWKNWIYAQKMIAKQLGITKNDANLTFFSKLMFLHGLTYDRGGQIYRELKQRYPGNITTASALGLRLQDFGPFRARDEDRPLISEDFLFQK